ncbi:hypothetical protein [Bdellovibrio sp. ZAP7]|uniref:hypothetical protein n=1 Tax=Bdellovibrio sp. ZAP7 TaxID=2231053 RepID=UPI001FED8913|nr:hypothetical protein [Bdellovibrio sp. ZAP7]
MSRFSYLLLSCIILFSLHSEAQTASKWSNGFDWTQRATKREAGRWSLTDWLAIKDKNRMMDQWLSLNSPSPYEFMLGGGYLSYDKHLSDGSVADSAHSVINGELAAYAQFVGVGAEYSNNTNENYSDLAGLFNLRVLGNSLQNTGLTFSYGLRTRDMTGTTVTKLSQQFAQADLQMYLTKYFGLDGKYRYYMPVSNDQLGDVKEDLFEASVFIDFKALRIFGSWVREKQKIKAPGGTDEVNTERTGIRSGIKLFF